MRVFHSRARGRAAAAVRLALAPAHGAARVLGRVVPSAGRAAMAALLLVALLLTCVGCAQARVDEHSPRVADVRLSSTSSMTESSQVVEVKVLFDRPISATDGVADDLRFLLNGSELDAEAVSLDVRASADSLTFSLRPAAGAQGLGKGSYFALYQAGFSVAAVRQDGAIPSVTSADGSCATLEAPVEGTLPSGLAIEVVDRRAGSSQDNAAAQATLRVTSPALVRAITWFSPDGGKTKLLKHNHTFSAEDASSCAADIARVVNEASGVGVRALCRGDEIVLTATEVVDGQLLDPVVVEGVGVEGGDYDPSLGGGAA